MVIVINKSHSSFSLVGSRSVGKVDMDMQLTPVSSEEAIFEWSDHSTSPDRDDVEEIIRQTQGVYPNIPRRPRVIRAPTRRRVRIDESCGDYSSVNFQHYKFGRIEMRAGSMDGSDGSNSSAITVMTSATSSCGDPWSAGGFVEEEQDDHEHNGSVEGSWDGEHIHEHDHDQDHDFDMLLEPKLEPLDDEVNLDSVAPRTSSTLPSPVQPKRPRGRPRKNPVQTIEPLHKIAKGRSKTGCVTCRRRKKKCDEAKPRCMNCEKNAVVCEGYPEKQVWKSGKEKAEEAARLRRVSLPNITLQPVIRGVETSGDKVFFEHYIYRLSHIFTVEGADNNAFKDQLLPMAVQHAGLMHSILSLSSKHINYDSEYGQKVLQQHPDIDRESLEERSQYHHSAAIEELHNDLKRHERGETDSTVISACLGQMLCLVLQTLADPNPNGTHRMHLEAYKHIIQKSQPDEGPFLNFIREFFQFHIILDEIIFLPEGRGRLGAVSDDWDIPSNIIQPDAVRLLGVNDGLFLYMSKITNIRNSIRHNIQNKIDPVVDYRALYRAAEIDAGIRDWTPAWPAGDSRDLAGLLYKQMMWVYLWRTINPPKNKSWKPDPRITQAVDDGIILLQQVPPRDPAQTLVLAPAFIIGCAAFEKRQREPIRKAISVVKAYMEYRNSDAALKVLEEVWRLMDARDERSWDWQSLAHGLGMDFLAT
ncbi:3bc7813b-9eb7-406c-afcc-96a629f5ed72 [Sclerotinia trifoliorum]|uniref:3bc7813b-9eb7-406c-afcc-96a629f5ed72 n=1 Tax=Sclerotinia trifoliorum TaxID=28548 RepID=A0A8H2VR32_9HELO|nr:3bc7813b-9eb7-406c-afcc-96a629f5ed72 [Sclerotinia trifoliorum]